MSAKTKNPRTAIQTAVEAKGFYWIGADRRSTEYGHNTKKFIVQVLADGRWAILTDDYATTICSGETLKHFESALARELKRKR